MAIRIDLYDVEQRTHFAPAGPDAAGWIGFVAASDADEGELVGLLDACAARGVLVGAGNHGADAASVTPDACAAVVTGSPLSRTWMDVIGWAAETAHVRGHQLGWLTRYDRGGSSDDGTDEWTTSWSDAPTEGSGADAPWPEG